MGGGVRKYFSEGKSENKHGEARSKYLLIVSDISGMNRRTNACQQQLQVNFEFQMSLSFSSNDGNNVITTTVNLQYSKDDKVVARWM